MTLLRSLFSLSVVVLSLSGCGSLLGGDHACDLRPKSEQCTDWRNLIGPTVTQEALCRTLGATNAGGTWLPNQRCAAEGSVGGCQTKSAPNILQTNWFYAPRTEASVRQECMDDGTTFVTP